MGNAAYKKRHKDQDLCVNCSRDAIPGRILCTIHSINEARSHLAGYYRNRKKILKKMKETRKQYIKDKRCPCCSTPLDLDKEGADEGMKTCISCRLWRTVPKKSKQEF